MRGRIAISGSSGFIGSALCDVLNCDCYTLSRNDILKEANLDRFNKDIDTIIHLAGLAHSSSFSEEEYQSVNVDGTLQLAIKAVKAGVKRFVFVSSIGVNGIATFEEPFTITSEPSLHNHFAQSKHRAEIGLKKISQDTGLEVVIVRPTLVYGLNAPGNFGALTRLVNRLPMLPFALVNNKRDFISLMNLADLLIACASHQDAAGHTFLASESETVSTKEFTNKIAKGLGKEVYQLPVPISLMRFAGKLLGKSAMVEQLVGNLQVDSSDLAKVLGWVPPYTMEESMALLKKQTKESK
ncbi:NAD-dependent epimerase/dehydratase family protein [Vibrio sp. Isolate33]|uniref:NAD-dependent epimerase/dehydratase family protein n=1 Tax=Vibrio sp. Isolate33 TaxID=2908539 RepID=UPI001EFD0BDC|nr:NAD-dependent epimerase/dehydratase family protein [Vibrio sp. Isolate33]MCG9544451.1 NAD-dependent epimerase/dehydratase family protein [Vibrio sp. Isolate33]